MGRRGQQLSPVLLPTMPDPTDSADPIDVAIDSFADAILQQLDRLQVYVDGRHAIPADQWHELRGYVRAFRLLQQARRELR